MARGEGQPRLGPRQLSPPAVPPDRRAEFQRREATFKRREEMLKKKDLDLQESLIKFNKFLQENDSKRGRAEKKEKEEIKQRSLKELEIVRLQELLERQKAQRDLMTLDLQKKMKYQQFLESVLDGSEDFPEIAVRAPSTRRRALPVALGRARRARSRRPPPSSPPSLRERLSLRLRASSPRALAAP